MVIDLKIKNYFVKGALHSKSTEPELLKGIPCKF